MKFNRAYFESISGHELQQMLDDCEVRVECVESKYMNATDHYPSGRYFRAHMRVDRPQKICGVAASGRTFFEAYYCALVEAAELGWFNKEESERQNDS